MRRNRKRELIPFRRSRRVIHIEKRGSRNGGLSALSAILLWFGILCILYCLGILLFMGYGTLFFLVWAVGGICCIGLSRILKREEWVRKIPRWIRVSFLSLVAVCAALFVMVEGMIISRFGTVAEPGADYCLILGAQIRASGPSDVLRRRLDAAIAYLEENPDTIAIVSGGQGSDEPVTEAEGMYTYLVAKGIAPERILREEESHNTVANLEYSDELYDIADKNVVLVTNNFHVFRAVSIAEKIGYEYVQGLAASSYPYMVPNNLLREFVGVMKELLTGSM